LLFTSPVKRDQDQSLATCEDRHANKSLSFKIFERHCLDDINAQHQ